MGPSVYACVRREDWHLTVSGLPPDVPVQSSNPATLLAVLDEGAAMAAIVDADFRIDGLSVRLAQLTRAGVQWPLLQLLRRGEALWQRKSEWAADAVRVEEARLQLWYRLRHRVTAWQLAATAEEALERCRGADELGNALCVALITERPFATFTGLARATGANVRTLYAQWKTVFGTSGEDAPHRFLQRVLLLRGIGARGMSRAGERSVASRLGVARSTFAGAAASLYGKTFAAVESTLGLRPLSDFHLTCLAPMGLGMSRWKSG